MTAKPDRTETSPLEDRLCALIASRGPISIADYMADALFHPHDGYYSTQQPIGAEGDFITAPEISQIFGELIGLWLVQSWVDIGAPGEFNLVELGPGRGVLMQDILRAARLRPDFLRAARIQLVESSGRLRHEQRVRLAKDGQKVDWRDSFDDLPLGPALIVANEFFDCLPIRQFVRTETSWRERMVGVNADGRLDFMLAPTPPDSTTALPPAGMAKPGDLFELGEAARDLAEKLSARIVAQGGRALIIDYGHIGSGFGETLQAVRRHQFWPVLAAPGRADITAHVDFEPISAAAFRAGAAAFGPITQGAFLERLGLSLRVERLCKGRSSAEADAIRAGAHRIAAPSQMGEIFKVLCIGGPGKPAPAGFDAP